MGVWGMAPLRPGPRPDVQDAHHSSREGTSSVPRFPATHTWPCCH